MSYLSKYMDPGMSIDNLIDELKKLIKEYNKIQETYLVVYYAACNKNVPGISLEQDDYYLIHDLLIDHKPLNRIDFYIETPGGSGEAADEIVNLLHEDDREVHIIVAGEAKSAGTLICLSGNEIWMTQTGSLGPIDAQIPSRLGRESAYDYVEWVENKRNESIRNQYLSPFDAVMIAQITPGELNGVLQALYFAEDMVIRGLTKYKFRNWKITETQQIKVDDQYRENRAREIAKELSNRNNWRSHGRSIKIEDLECKLKLKINKIDENKKLADIVYNIKAVCLCLCGKSSVCKIIATEHSKVLKQQVPVNTSKESMNHSLSEQEVSSLVISTNCDKCNLEHNVFISFSPVSEIPEDLMEKITKDDLTFFPKDDKILCKCGYEIDLSGIKTDLELRTGKKIFALENGGA